jgi:hypothetical protein
MENNSINAIINIRITPTLLQIQDVGGWTPMKESLWSTVSGEWKNVGQLYMFFHAIIVINIDLFY